MPTSPSSSAQGAREALAVRLSHLRMDAGLTGRELSARCGWHPAKTTRLQKGKAPPTDADIRAWCRACEADDQAEDLIAIARAVDAMYVEWRKLHHSGMRRAQAKLIKQYSETAVTRAYVSNVMPGFFQTTAYATALMQSITDFQGTPDDVTEAVAARVSRSRFLYEGGHQFIVLIEESVLRYRIGDARTMAGQLQHLLVVMALPSVTLGVIPFGVQRTVWPLEAFYLHDNRRAAVETLTAKINVVKPRELGDYAKAFVELSRLAVYGDSARGLIERATNAL